MEYVIGYFVFGVIAALIITWREAEISDEFPWLQIFVCVFFSPIVVTGWVSEFIDWAKEWKNPFYTLRHKEKNERTN